MRSIGIRALNSRLREYVRLAAGGETVLVTDRGRVVAEMGPPRAERSPILADAKLADAVRKGWLTPALYPGSEPPVAGIRRPRYPRCSVNWKATKATGDLRRPIRALARPGGG